MPVAVKPRRKDPLGRAERRSERTFGLAPRSPIFSTAPWLAPEMQSFLTYNPKEKQETLVALSRKYTPEAVLTLVHHMRNLRDPELSMRAASLLIDRGWGKAPEMLAVATGGNGNMPEALRDLPFEERLKRLEATAMGETIDVTPPSAPPSDPSLE